jgi:CRP-like cAMP-binding protein
MLRGEMNRRDHYRHDIPMPGMPPRRPTLRRMQLFQPRSCSMVAVTGATLARMPARVFRETLHEHADACSHLLALLAARIRLLDDRVSEFATMDIKHRVFAELPRLSRPSGDTGRAVVAPPPFHAEIAARVSARREAVTRELLALGSAGLLERRRGSLVLTDVPTLKAMIRRSCERAA